MGPFRAVVLLLAALSLAGCGGGSLADNVDVTLPFVGNITKDKKAKEEKMARRNSLVLPPKVTTLPEPGEKGSDPALEQWPDDPDVRAKREAEVAEAEDRRYRREGDWKGERDSGNGLEDFNKKVDWSKRQKGVFTQGEGVSDKYRK